MLNKNYIKYIGVTFGSDPEVFLKKDGKVIGSEKVIPEIGFTSRGRTVWDLNGNSTRVPIYSVIRDGVQAELNVLPHTCRQSFSSHLASEFRLLASKLPKGVGVDFSATVDVTPEEMESLSPKSQAFGCAPSLNAYGDNEMSIQDASKYYKRSAGGHIHLGFRPTSPQHTTIILDILLGNTCVLLDRDEGNKERRKVYGKAGEYRIPDHGLEYRVLSNFWLRNYQTMSFVLAMARFAIAVAEDAEMSARLLALVNLDKIRYAINNNDYRIALENFGSIKDLVASMSHYSDDMRKENPVPYDDKIHAFLPLEGYRMDLFVKFMEKGLDHWFMPASLAYWVNYALHQDPIPWGWEGFLTHKVALEGVVDNAPKKVTRATFFN